MKILFIGDIYGKPGREVINTVLPKLKAKKKIDLVIANVENLAHGSGVTKSTLDEILSSGVDFFTGGNHIFKKEGLMLLEKDSYPLIRPANYCDEVPGVGYKIIEKKKKKILVINLMGRVFMPGNIECPFKTVEKILKETKKDKIDYSVVDLHAEATSEKVAMKFFLDGKVTALLGTHTHIQTSDLQITSEGTAYITDTGMVGVVDDSVLGVKSEIILKKFLTQISTAHEVADIGGKVFNAVLIDTGIKKYAEKVELFNDHIN